MDAPEISWETSVGAPNGIPFDFDTLELVENCMNQPMPPLVELSKLKKKSKAFPIRFPIKQVRCTALWDRKIPKDILEFNANSTYPIIHEAMLPLIASWLRHKQEHGSSVEKAIYKDMTLIQLIQRLLELRAVVFYGAIDRWRLINNKMGLGNWETVGTEDEKEPLVLSKCLSYDEIKLSAMMIVSSHSEFINDGSRENRGVLSNDPNSYQPRGVIMGVVGTRLKRPRFMEYQDIIITPDQNKIDNGYGPLTDNPPPLRNLRTLWSRFYGEEYHPLYNDAARQIESSTNRRYIALHGHRIFNVEIYMKRIILSAEIILLEANARAEKQNKKAFLHVVGFGLGVWRIMNHQAIYFLKAFEIALKKMNRNLKYVSDILFSDPKQKKWRDAGNGYYIGDIKIHFGLREPHSKLVGVDANKLLVVTYPWDGNAYPGNEFWQGSLKSTGDPAAACSSQVSELHNARINPRACGANLHIASPEHGLLHISEYAKLHLA